MKIKLNKSQKDLIMNGNTLLGKRKIYFNPLYYIETEDPNVFEVKGYKELSKEEQYNALGAQVANLKSYMEKYGE